MPMETTFIDGSLAKKFGTLIDINIKKQIMKKVLFTLAAVCFSFGFINAQSNEGHIKYKIEVSSDDPDMAMGVSMLNGASMEITFDGENSVSTMNMGAMMSITTITNDSDEVLMLMGGMMGKKAIKTSVEEMKNSKEDEEMPDIEVQLVKGKKTVAGYDCKKAIIETEGGEDIIYWYTEEFKMANEGQGNANGKIPGIALAFETNNGGMLMSFEASEVDLKVKDKSVFTMEIPEGYEEMSYEELSSMGM